MLLLANSNPFDYNICVYLINFKDISGEPALHKAAEKGRESLVDNNANVNAQSPQNITPLMKAAEKGYEKIVEFLIEHGAEVWPH